MQISTDSSKSTAFEVYPTGLGGFDLKGTDDKAFAFDYDSDGKLDHIVFYRPGSGTFWIVANENGSFRNVFSEGSPGSGVAGYGLNDPADRAIAFDYNSTGRLDHIVLYNPNIGRLSVVRKNGATNTFESVYTQDNSDETTEVKLSAGAQVIAFDYEKKGCLDHLFIYYPGTGENDFFKFPKSIMNGA
jgi:hypothetical protein